MLIDVVRKLLIPGEYYEYLMYHCMSAYEGVFINHLETCEEDYRYAVVSDTGSGIDWKLLPTKYLAEKYLELTPESHIIKVKL